MTVSASARPAVRAAFSALVDYAGLFPPAQLGVADAYGEYVEARRGAYAWMLGRFIVRVSQRAPLLGLLADAAAPLRTSLILDEGRASLARVAELRRETRLSVETLEVALKEEDLRLFESELHEIGLATIETYVESPSIPFERLRELGLGAKIRCGGAQPDSYPSIESVAAFVQGCARADVRFKATAGLHHPVRHLNPAAGVTMHGFLNLIVATLLARAGAGSAAVCEAIACEDAAAFVFDDEGMTFGGVRFPAGDVQRMRDASFVAYGSCSFDEPVDDLRRLGILN